MPRSINAVIISDSRIGHQNQSIALCRWMGWNHIILPVKYRFPGARALTLALDPLGIRPSFPVAGLTNPFEYQGGLDVVVGTGSRTYYAAKVLASRWKVPAVAILNPGILSRGFRAIIVPEYENSMPHSKRLIKLPVNLSVPDPDRIRESMDELYHRIGTSPGECWGLIIGGENKTSYIDPEDLRVHLKSIRNRMPAGVKLLATTSRRSGPAIENIIREADLDMAVLAGSDHFNPIPAFTRLCGRIFVTSDSASMISEVVTNGDAAIEVLMNRQKVPKNKFLRFIENLEQSGHVHVFDGEIGEARAKVDIRSLASDIRSRLFDDESDGTEAAGTPHGDNGEVTK